MLRVDNFRNSFLPSKVLSVSYVRPGIISLAFYKRRPSRVKVILGLIATIVLSALLGDISPNDGIGQLGSVILAVIGGVILYVMILAYLIYRYQPRHAKPPMQTSSKPTLKTRTPRLARSYYFGFLETRDLLLFLRHTTCHSTGKSRRSINIISRYLVIRPEISDQER